MFSGSAMVPKLGSCNTSGRNGKRAMNVTCKASSIPADRVPDTEKRKLTNLLLLGALSLPAARVMVEEEVLSHKMPLAMMLLPLNGGRLMDQVTGLLLNDSRETQLTLLWRVIRLATYGSNAVCTHLGFVVPFKKAENKFIYPCHGSQYNNQGRVVRGPAPLSPALSHVDIDDGRVLFVPWMETDFITGEAPLWD